jgi:DNA-binding NarL/FixJ family response regulator
MLTVFIADDSVVVRGRLKNTLEEQGAIQVVGDAGEAEQAMREMRRIKPQVAIIDIRMPGGGGLPVLKDYKERNPEGVAIILTSFPYPQYQKVYLEAGADYFFDKTRDIPEMTETLIEMTLKIGS